MGRLSSRHRARRATIPFSGFQFDGLAGSRKSLRVLVADDNRDSADSCATLLQMAGHDVRAVYSGTEALEAAAAVRPEVALLDIGMPGMNGFEVPRAIRATDWGKNVVLVAVTGWGQEEDRRQAEAAGFDHHCAKPLDLLALEPLLAGIAREP